jgi:hypothetical protein
MAGQSAGEKHMDGGFVMEKIIGAAPLEFRRFIHSRGGSHG